jgi:hypothetical protein
VAHLPTAVSLLLLKALFMQISGVSLALTWPPKALFTQCSPGWEPLLQAFPFPSTLGEVTLHQLSQACVFIYSSCGNGLLLLSCGAFLPQLLLRAFPLLIAGHVLLLLLSLAGLFIYSSGKDFPSLPLQHSGQPALFATCLFCCYCLLLNFSVFPWVGVSLSRRLC